MTTTARRLPALALGDLTPDAHADAGIRADGDTTVLDRLAAVLDPGDPDFPIVTP
ncbi:alkyl sulfatase C-terminal domain-containing protein [Streptomyces anulatus]|uniref:alkyl sulfatase C-terminal domain-containing protein n=1 Tax=Streptomyces anulatus TaxID=1892 RepID=UPI003673E463